MDNRLSKLVRGVYRIWSDTYQTQIPVGQSTTKPLVSESISTGVRVYGTINKGYFQNPIVEFSNTLPSLDLFDKYTLQIWRDDLPSEPDWIIDLGLTTALVDYKTLFKCNDISGYDKDQTFLRWNGSAWISPRLHFSSNSTSRLSGDYWITTDNSYTIGKTFSTNSKINGKDLYLIVENGNLRYGESNIDLVYSNKMFALELDHFEITILGGGT